MRSWMQVSLVGCCKLVQEAKAEKVVASRPNWQPRALAGVLQTTTEAVREMRAAMANSAMVLAARIAFVVRLTNPLFAVHHSD